MTSDEPQVAVRDDVAPALLRAPRLSTDRRRTIAPIASGLIPGSGQVLLGQSRGLVYLAVDAVAWWRYTIDVHDRRDQEARFKDVARRVARAPFSSAPRDTTWDYYEAMRDHLESGQYSMSSTTLV